MSVGRLLCRGLLAGTILSLISCGQPGGNGSGNGSSETGSRATAQQLIDAKYLDNQYSVQSQTTCVTGADDYLRSIARYDYAWDDDAKGFTGVKFDKYMTYVSAPGVLTLSSTRAKLQNGFGAYEHIDLYCNYDTQHDKVLGYDTAPPPPMRAASEASLDEASSVVPPPPTSSDKTTSPAVASAPQAIGTEASQAVEDANVALPPAAPGPDRAGGSLDVPTMINANPYLRRENGRIASIYGTLLTKATPEQRDQFAQEQSAWIAERDACGNQGCLTASYGRRFQTVTSEAWTQYRAQNGRAGQ